MSDRLIAWMILMRGASTPTRHRCQLLRTCFRALPWRAAVY